MRKEKVLGTDIMVGGELAKRLAIAGYVGTHYQFRVICKCTGIYNANTKCEKLGYGKIFRPDYTSETGNKTELEFIENSGCDIAFCIDGTIGDEYISYDDLMKIELPEEV